MSLTFEGPVIAEEDGYMLIARDGDMHVKFRIPIAVVGDIIQLRLGEVRRPDPNNITERQQAFEKACQYAYRHRPPQASGETIVVQVADF